MGKFIWVLLYIFNWAICDEVYQNSSHICNRCHCDDKNAFILDCTNQKFEHVLANWPAHNKLLIATFSYNNITTLEQLPLTNYTAKLVFDHCNIQYLDRGVFSNIKNIEFLDLSYNLLTTAEISGDDFKGPYDNKRYGSIALKYLNLAYNQIHSLPRTFFENMPDLEELNLEGNDFKVLDPSTQVALGSLAKIKKFQFIKGNTTRAQLWPDIFHKFDVNTRNQTYKKYPAQNLSSSWYLVLNLANNSLTELEGNLIRKLHTLNELDLSSNHLDFVPKILNYISKNLKLLKLSNNYIFKLTYESFYGFDLTELHLNNLPRLKLVEANTFATQKNLKKLYLSGNPNLQVIDKEAFADNQILDELDLSNNSLNDINHMLNWSKLKILKIDSNLLECSCSLYNITKVLPKSITRALENPTCTDEIGEITQRVYDLDERICSGDHSLQNSKLMRHFNVVRITIIVASILLITITGIILAVVLLRYRKRIAFSNYPFAAQVSYYPIQTQHI